MDPVIFKYFLSFIDTNPHTHITNLKRNQYNLSSHTTHIRHLFDLIYDFNTIVSNWSLTSVPFCHNSRNGETTWSNLNSFVIIKKAEWNKIFMHYLAFDISFHHMHLCTFFRIDVFGKSRTFTQPYLFICHGVQHIAVINLLLWNWI